MDCSQCPSCSSDDIQRSGANTYCEQCGYILNGTPDIEHSEPGWTEYEDRRLGPAQSSQYLSKGTCIGNESERANGRIQRFAKFQARLRSEERTLRAGLDELRCVVAGFELGDSVAESASTLLRTVARQGLFHGRSVDAMAAACVYVAARQQEIPLANSTIATQAAESESRIRNHVRVLQRELDTEIPPLTAIDYLPKIVSDIGFGIAVETTASQLLAAAQDRNMHSGKGPQGLAAAAIYTVASDHGKSITQQEVAAAADVSEITISRHYGSLRELHEEMAHTSPRKASSGV